MSFQYFIVCLLNYSKKERLLLAKNKEEILYLVN